MPGRSGSRARFYLPVAQGQVGCASRTRSADDAIVRAKAGEAARVGLIDRGVSGPSAARVSVPAARGRRAWLLDGGETLICEDP
jgi:hypothetical protein